MSFLLNKYHDLLKELSDKHISLVAVTKTKPAEEIMSAYEAGHRDFGENYVQELIDKYQALPKDIRWHFIGHLQSNKIKYIASFIHLIHGVDSEHLLTQVNKQGEKINRVIPCLLQMHIAEEETKFGFDEEELHQVITKLTGKNLVLQNVSIRGLMGMASFSDNQELVRGEFRKLHRIFKETGQRLPPLNDPFSILSMGMSSDYQLALEEGSNMVRIGSLLFGPRG